MTSSVGQLGNFAIQGIGEQDATILKRAHTWKYGVGKNLMMSSIENRELFEKGVIL